MKRLPLGRRKHLGVTFFRWGVYVQVRREFEWHHLKIGAWRQGTLRADTRSQQRRKREGWTAPARYVQAFRMQASYWRSWKGGSRRPYMFGLMLYGGGGTATLWRKAT